MVLRADRDEYLHLCREISRQSNAAANHRPKDAGKRHVAEDEAAVRRIETCITNWINPFQAGDKLCHVASVTCQVTFQCEVEHRWTKGLQCASTNDETENL